MVNQHLLHQFAPVRICAINQLDKLVTDVRWVYNSVSVSDEEMQEHYDGFFEEIFVELEDKVWSTLRNRI